MSKNKTFQIALIRLTEENKKNASTKNKHLGLNYFSANIQQQNRQRIVNYIENLMINIQDAEMNGNNPSIEIRDRHKWENCNFNKILTLKSLNEASSITVNTANKGSKTKFMLLVLLLSKIHHLLQWNQKITKRELYYQNIAFVKTQSILDNIINDVCTLLETPAWELGIITSSKGLIAGNIKITLSDGSVIDCYNKIGTLIPQDIVTLQEIETQAKFILVVEKDAIFQKLLDDDILLRLGPLILITGKGFPDVNTRLLLKRIWLKTQLPIFALVDADPYGIDIMCVYRFGSLALSYQSDNLAVPSLRWIGVHPKDIQNFHLPSIPLITTDGNKLNRLKERPYMNDKMKDEINILIDNRMKTEIEALTTCGNFYIIDVYLSNKICTLDII